MNQQSRLVEVFKILGKSELIQLKKYLNSPYFNTSQSIINLFEYLKAELNKCADKDVYRLSDAKAFKKVYKETWKDIKKQKDKLKQIKKQLLEHVEHFLALEYAQQVEEEGILGNFEIQKRYSLVDRYSQSNLKRQYQRLLDKTKTDLKNVEKLDASYFQEVEKLNYYYFQLSLPTELDHAKLQEYVHHMIQNTDFDYYYKKIKYYVMFATQTYIYKKNYELPQVADSFDFFKDKDLEQYPFVAGYYYYAQILYHNLRGQRHQVLEASENLKVVLFTQSKRLHQFDLRQLYTGFVNHYSLQLINGHNEFYADLFEVYKAAMEAQIFELEGYLYPDHYRKCVQFAAILGEFEWAEQYIEKFQYKLRSEWRESHYVFAKALLWFYKKEYEQAIQTINKLDPKDLYLKIFGRILAVKICYESDDLLENIRVFRKEGSDILLENYLTNVQDWFRDKGREDGVTVAEDIQPFYKDFIDLLLKLYRIKESPNRSAPKEQQKLLQIKEELVSKNVCEKDWLLQKAKELMREG